MAKREKVDISDIFLDGAMNAQEKAMRNLIVLAVFYTISSSLSLGLLKLPTVPAAQYSR